MKSIIFFLFGCFLISMVSISCVTSSMPEKQSVPMEFTIAKGYFVKNTIIVNEPLGIVIKNQQELDSIMGFAATMGVNGKPTSFDFTKDYGVACIFPETDSSRVLEVMDYTVTEDKGRLSIKVKTGEKQTYSIVPTILIKVSGIPPATLVVEKNF
ncbi:MAG: hypothetical protein FGM61_06510 [Sediminibacterium sp.]|nr:hypothetical protein [Sediminibacterium sp.]